MQREIKFRVWLKKSEQMVNVENIDFKAGYIEHKDSVLTFSFEDIELMQFTGLTDKNGTEVYEGDIVKKNKEQSIVYFEDGCFYVKFKDCRYRVGGFDKAFIEIIGNIYENPELLK